MTEQRGTEFVDALNNLAPQITEEDHQAGSVQAHIMTLDDDTMSADRKAHVATRLQMEEVDPVSVLGAVQQANELLGIKPEGTLTQQVAKLWKAVVGTGISSGGTTFETLNPGEFSTDRPPKNSAS